MAMSGMMAYSYAYVWKQPPERRLGETSFTEDEHHITIAANFIQSAFVVPSWPYSVRQQELPKFIGKVIRGQRHPSNVVIFALFLLYHLKLMHSELRKLPQDRVSRMFLSAIMLSAKILIEVGVLGKHKSLKEDSYVEAVGKGDLFLRAASGAFTPDELNQSEQELLKHVKDVRVPEQSVLDVFENYLIKRYGYKPQPWVRWKGEKFGVSTREFPIYGCPCQATYNRGSDSKGKSSSSEPPSHVSISGR